MAEPAKQLKLEKVEEITGKPSDDQDDALLIKQLENTHTVELVISLCGFVGTDIHEVGEKIKEILVSSFDYEVEIIKLSTLIKQFSKAAKGIDRSIGEYNYTNTLIRGGNELRELHDNNILACLAIQKMRYDRFEQKAATGQASFKSRRICYIIDSIKNTDELELLKIVYRDIHYSIGIFSPIEERQKNLRLRSMSEPEISSLIDLDSGEEIPQGQKVRDTFIRSDYFLRIESAVNQSIEEKLKRFLNLIFCTKVVTPTFEETAMYHAASAANNSACLSRQVGAALTDSKGEILSIGWNDVPKAGGGLYQSKINDLLSSSDMRCWNLGSKGCWNDEEKNIITNDLVNILIDEKIVEESKRAELFKKVRNSKIKSIVEFSRAIHAEMHAIITASQTAGERVRDGSLYITTYPCHNCARHIIVAGIKKVYYIEPYRKSLTTKLHYDAITEKEEDTEKVVILMYDGVAPERFMELFKMIPNSRKFANGKKIVHDLKLAKPKTTLSLEAIPVLETKVVTELQKKGLLIS